MSSHQYQLGNERKVFVCEWKGEKRVDLREWVGEKPTKKGISLTVMRWKNWTDHIEYVDQSLKENTEYSCHLGGNVYCTVEKDNPCVDIRQFWKPEPEGELVRTKKGLRLRPQEYKRLKELISDIDQTLPETSPCYFQADHANQIGMMNCSECYPDYHNNW